VQRRYGLTPEDIALAKRHRRAHNRLGFAVQLALVHDLGRPLRAKEELPAAVIEVIADQLGIAPAVFEVYAQRDATRREHVGEIVTHLRLRTIQQPDYRAAILAAAASAVGTEKGEAIVRAILDDLKARRIIVPVASLVERFALAGRAWARRQAYRDLVRHLDPPTREQLEALLTAQTEEGRTVHGWISEVPEGPKLKNLVGVVARLDILRRIGIPDDWRKAIHANRYGLLAREAKITHARGLLDFVAWMQPESSSIKDLAKR
jgi:hypothetical protein